MTHPPVTESGSADTEFTEEQHRARMAALSVPTDLSVPSFLDRTNNAEPATAPDPERSRNALANFKAGCKTWLPVLTDDD